MTNNEVIEDFQNPFKPAWGWFRTWGSPWPVGTACTSASLRRTSSSWRPSRRSWTSPWSRPCFGPKMFRRTWIKNSRKKIGWKKLASVRFRERKRNSIRSRSCIGRNRNNVGASFWSWVREEGGCKIRRQDIGRLLASNITNRSKTSPSCSKLLRKWRKLLKQQSNFELLHHPSRFSQQPTFYAGILPLSPVRSAATGFQLRHELGGP